jgi:hypothetical protein
MIVKLPSDGTLPFLEFFLLEFQICYHFALNFQILLPSVCPAIKVIDKILLAFVAKCMPCNKKQSAK